MRELTNEGGGGAANGVFRWGYKGGQPPLRGEYCGATQCGGDGPLGTQVMGSFKGVALGHRMLL